MPDPRRRDLRQRTLKGARLSYDDGVRERRCVVRDLSDRGARIEVADIRTIPSEFVLTFDTDGVARTCFVKWRRGDSLGVEFIAASW